MSYSKFLEKMHMEKGKVVAVTRFKAEAPIPSHGTKNCFFQYLTDVFQGEVLEVSAETIPCPGFKVNAGLVGGLPKIPGGFENFLSQGCNQPGCPPGEKIKRAPELVRKFIEGMPSGVMGEYNALRFETYEEGMEPDLVICFVTVDQLVGCTYLQNYDNAGYDSAIVATTAGCASIVKIPLGELEKDQPRAVIGSLDSASRIFHDKELLAFTVTGKEFRKMISYTDECFFETSFWRAMEKRM